MSSVPLPPMNQPWMVAAFQGWNDAADAASGTVDHLIEEWDAELLVELDPEDFYDYQVNRPTVHVNDEHQRVLTWPTAAIFHALPPGSDRDVLLLRAPEPNFRWKAFCAAITTLAQSAGVTELITLGALLADSPHTRPVPVSGSTTDPTLMERMNLQPSRYSGPVGITAALNEAADAAGIATASLWAAVPHYLAEPPCPKATLALLGALEDALAMPLPQGVLVEMSDAWQRGAEDLTSREPDIAEYVEALEEDTEPGDLPEASGDAIAREFERYLRRRGTDK